MRGGAQRATRQDRRKSAHLAGQKCSHCSHSKQVCSHTQWEQNSSMLTTTYARFWGLFPLFPRKKNDSWKETAESEVHPAPWCPTFTAFVYLLAIRWATQGTPPSWLVRVCSAADGGKLNRRPWGVVLLPAVPGVTPAAQHPGSDPHPQPPYWVLPGVAVYGSFTPRSGASVCGGERVYGERCTVYGGQP